MLSHIIEFSVSVVTLHVSVWVEIISMRLSIAKSLVTLHVSVWVEISSLTSAVRIFQSRSTWACELKLQIRHIELILSSHAPRERVSWNCSDDRTENMWVESRSTWACELKCQRFVLTTWKNWSRSTWACELKCKIVMLCHSFFRHAPRERVSWN